jgi:hypothetical protein
MLLGNETRLPFSCVNGGATRHEARLIFPCVDEAEGCLWLGGEARFLFCPDSMKGLRDQVSFFLRWRMKAWAMHRPLLCAVEINRKRSARASGTSIPDIPQSEERHLPLASSERPDLDLAHCCLLLP